MRKATLAAELCVYGKPPTPRPPLGARLRAAGCVWGGCEQAMETAQRILAQDAQNIEALRLTVLLLLARETRYGVAAQRIRCCDEKVANRGMTHGGKPLDFLI